MLFGLKAYSTNLHIEKDPILYWKGCEGVQIVILLKRGECDWAGNFRLFTI